MVAWGIVSQSCKYAQTWWKLKLYTRSELSRKSLNKKPPTSSTSNQIPEPLPIHLQNIHPRAQNTNLSKLGREKWHPGKFMKWYAPLQNREAVAREMQCVRKHPGRSSMQPSLSFASPAKASECLLPVILALAGGSPTPGEPQNHAEDHGCVLQLRGSRLLHMQPHCCIGCCTPSLIPWCMPLPFVHYFADTHRLVAVFDYSRCFDLAHAAWQIKICSACGLSGRSWPCAGLRRVRWNAPNALECAECAGMRRL